MKEMKTISFNGQQYEIVDAEARKQIDAAKESILLIDTATNNIYKIQITNGELVTTLVEE